MELTPYKTESPLWGVTIKGTTKWLKQTGNLFRKKTLKVAVNSRLKAL